MLATTTLTTTTLATITPVTTIWTTTTLPVLFQYRVVVHDPQQFLLCHHSLAYMCIENIGDMHTHCQEKSSHC